MRIPGPEQLTEREREMNEHEALMLDKQIEHVQKTKALELEMAKLEVRWTSWLKTIIKLPVYILFGIAFCISMITKKEMPEDFWRFLK